ncbi:MAG: B12-binding domain-containing radical SAM protein [Tenericutes bacterium HGW-Tenericutes-1]|nr:MAG: B12-binding domain-containing radical SAM protein [Tenericutes bacterium HGW-Tenericutes-1]
MNILLVSIDSKYIHTNMALRYLKANLSLESKLLEFTIKDDLMIIEEAILEEQPNIIAFSVYLWNVEKVVKLIESIKAKSNAIIVMGGPEVSYEPVYFMTNSKVDYIISGEGEIAFDQLVTSIDQNNSINQIPGLIYRENEKIIQNPIRIINNLDSLKNPYHMIEDISKLSTRIQYIEMSRGCPFNCSYCLASLDNNVRFFNIERVKKDIFYLMANGVKTFKFLDRTFNYKISNALEIFDFIIKNHYENTQFQFEITGDLLPRELIIYINENAPKGLIRFEIGIQSTHEATNLSVNRIQNNEKLMENIRLIQDGGIIDLHLDLIAGLPLEDLNRFSQTFDEVFQLYPKELQLGFLKMLRGTKIRREADKYGYLYDSKPPYEMQSNNILSKEDILEIHYVEEVLETFWNKGFMPLTMRTLIEREVSAFKFMNSFAHFLINRQFDFHRYQLSDLFVRLSQFILQTNRNNNQILDVMKKEYLLRSTIKTHIWWDDIVSKIEKNHLFQQIINEHPDIKIDDLFKYSTTIHFKGHYLTIIYYPETKRIIEY